MMPIAWHGGEAVEQPSRDRRAPRRRACTPPGALPGVADGLALEQLHHEERLAPSSVTSSSRTRTHAGVADLVRDVRPRGGSARSTIAVAREVDVEDLERRALAVAVRRRVDRGHPADAEERVQVPLAADGLPTRELRAPRGRLAGAQALRGVQRFSHVAAFPPLLSGWRALVARSERRPGRIASNRIGRLARASHEAVRRHRGRTFGINSQRRSDPPYAFASILQPCEARPRPIARLPKGVVFRAIARQHAEPTPNATGAQGAARHRTQARGTRRIRERGRHEHGAGAIAGTVGERERERSVAHVVRREPDAPVRLSARRAHGDGHVGRAERGVVARRDAR